MTEICVAINGDCRWIRGEVTGELMIALGAEQGRRKVKRLKVRLVDGRRFLVHPASVREVRAA